MKISFTIPTKNCVTWLPHAVISCLEQTHKNVEVIIVDDGSTDDTPEYLKYIAKDKRVLCLINEQSAGQSESRNRGNKEAQGELICVLDADDIATPQRAELMAHRFRENNVDFIHGVATAISCLGYPTSAFVDRFGNFSETSNPERLTKEAALKDMTNGIVHSTVCYTNDFSVKYPYPTDPQISRLGVDDWSQQITALLNGAKMDFVGNKLACYRRLISQITHNRDQKEVIEFKNKFLASLSVVA